MFSLKFKTSVLSKQAIKAFQNTSFSKVAVVIRFPAKKKKTPVAQKHRAISRQEKMAFSILRRVVLGLSSPSPRVCTGGRTLTSQPKFLGTIGYEICLAMVLRYQKHSSKNTIAISQILLTCWLYANSKFSLCQEILGRWHPHEKYFQASRYSYMQFS